MVYIISHKTLIVAKPLCIRHDKVEGFVRIYDRTRYLVLLSSEKYIPIYNRVRYVVGLKCGTTYVFSHNYARIKVDSYGFLPLEETFAFHNVVIHIKSVLKKDQNQNAVIYS